MHCLAPNPGPKKGYLPVAFGDDGFMGSWYCDATVPAIGFFTAVFGFLTSRLPRFCPFAIFRCPLIGPPCGHEIPRPVYASREVFWGQAAWFVTQRCRPPTGGYRRHSPTG